ncbi:general secretion pathway protein GspF [Flavobacterium columnare NBRC 100251 = ATCC 23463]|uniref:type II secretion system F family protein n=1 Tax=Flavobacterium columnare TaxID=996 RepID=UPI000BE9A8E6|nr:type II secretion system F family protein [Flavobacterium columnare]PDS23810.1 general secretion pathway protein GspF [Flavobacterium columnare NBRC 100251 = ATCC 23463]GEM58524.1 general secretion pathway protein GspF [Flavobacterium columnare NBRC 100251 = ATCC 23463]
MSFDLNTYKKNHTINTEKSSNVISFPFRKKFSDKKKENFYRELGLLLKSGVDFKKALEILSNQSTHKTEKEIITSVKTKVSQGRNIYESIKETNQFSPYEYYSIQIGEETRKLEDILHELQKYFNRKIQMKRQIVSVLTYPVIVLIVTFLVLYFMLNKVVPMFSSVFKQFGNELPKSTQLIISLSNHSGKIFSSFLFVVIILFITHYSFKKNNQYRAFTTGLTLRLPYFGNLIQKIYLSRFCQAMSLLITSRTTLINALSLTSKMISFYPIENSIETIKKDITKGASLSESLKKHPVFEAKMVSMIEVSEQVNQLDSMFEKLTEQYNEEVNHQTKMIGVILEPMLIIVIGVIVGIIMISMYAPMFDLSKIIKN